MNIKDKKPIIILIVTILVLVIGVSLAYFGLTIIGNDTAKKNKIVTGNLELTFTDNDEISLSGVFPGDSITKTITVKNTGTKEASYNLVWTELTNEFINDEIIVEATCKNINSSNTEDGTCNSISQKTVSSASNITSNIPVKPGYTQEYTVKITFIDTGKPQNYNKNKSFTGKLGITESSAKTVYCTYDGDLKQGATYINGQYTYTYMREYSNDENAWVNITSDGWGVQLTDKKSTNAVTSNLCTYINDKPIVSMAYMFSGSKATTLDLSSFNTSTVENMKNMFWFSSATTINLSSFNTSKVTNMNSMFGRLTATSLDVSSFNTSNVTNMGDMFGGATVTSLDLSNFNTSNVTDMNNMFWNTQIKTLDLSSFNTSKVTNMNSMFSNIKAETLNLSSFDTSKVTDMSGMFYEITVTTLDLNNFNTSNVKYMYGMFTSFQGNVLDLSSFDTSNVVNMMEMFSNCPNLNAIIVSEKFNTDNVNVSDYMFAESINLMGGEGTAFDSNHVDKEYARIDEGPSNPGYFTGKVI